MMAVEIRLLQAGDEHILATAAPGVFDDPIHPDSTRIFLSDPRHHIAIALEDGVVVGFASGVHYHHPDKPAPELFVNEVGVAESHQRRGIGKRILRALLRTAQEAGCSQAWVLTDRSNEPAMHLYASLGGEEHPSDQVMFSYYLGAQTF